MVRMKIGNVCTGQMFSQVLAVGELNSKNNRKLNRGGVEQGVPDPHVPKRPAASGTVEELRARPRLDLYICNLRAIDSE
jgi:hypothetical protein